ncbi:MAG TPA: transketolase C-terminal domain-containing protein [Chthonomonadaceae bacterium]|nr:transketolase C-terminal domain-containing protein [Chthonomonadaceae bacterium]
MRRAFADTLFEMAGQDPRVIFLTGDLGFQVFDAFQERYGDRYINVGVAEAQMICAAAGLAFEGWRPTCYSIASFLTGRAFEQIRVSVAYPGLPVVLVGAGGGYTYASSGVTHHAPDDVALLSSLPGMTVVTPGDPDEIRQLLPQMYRLPGPSYIRVGRFGEASYEACEPAVLGRARLLREGERLAVVSSGDITPGVLQAVDRLQAEGLSPLAYHFHTVKPLDTEALARIAERADTLLIVEESVPSGGLFQSIAAWRAEAECPVRLRRLGPPDAFALGGLKREVLRARLQYDADAVYAACKELWTAQRALQLAA